MQIHRKILWIWRGCNGDCARRASLTACPPMQWTAVLPAVGVVFAAPAAAADPICADRPGKGTATCTVPAGVWQVETALIDWTRDDNYGIRTDVTAIGSSLIKYGMSERADIELGVTPWVVVRTRGAGTRETISGAGDVLLRVKYRLTSDNAPVSVAIDPFVKLPTARKRLGNGKVEAGVALPVSAVLGSTAISVSATPELAWRVDGDGRGRHPAMIQMVGLGFSPSARVSLSAELWGQWDWDPAGTGKQVSGDGSIAYLLGDSMQLDAGANFGLNRRTPAVQVYAGVSKRF